ncbi:hypothetical protein HK405_009691, partial [Cladochytrium tenue]
ILLRMRTAMTNLLPNRTVLRPWAQQKVLPPPLPPSLLPTPPPMMLMTASDTATDVDADAAPLGLPPNQPPLLLPALNSAVSRSTVARNTSGLRDGLIENGVLVWASDLFNDDDDDDSMDEDTRLAYVDAHGSSHCILAALAEVAARVSRLRSPGHDSSPGFAAAQLRRLSTRLDAFSITMVMASTAASWSGGSRLSILFGSPPSASSSLPEHRTKRQSVNIDQVADASPPAGSALSHWHNTDSDSLALLQAWMRPVLPPERQPSASSARNVTTPAAAATADPELAKLASRLHPGTRNWLVEAVRDWALDAESPGVLWLGEVGCLRAPAREAPSEVPLAGVNQRCDLTQLAMLLVRLVLDDPDVSVADALEEAARALTEKSHGCFLWMALAFEPLLHPGIGGDDALLRRVLSLLARLREPVSISALADQLEEVPEREVSATRCSAWPASSTAGAFVSAAADAVAVAIQLAHLEVVAAVLDRCPNRRFSLDPLLAEANVPARCLSQLVRRLRPNSLNMEDPAAWLNAEIPDRDVRVAARVPEVLRYSARNFAVHLARIGDVLLAFIPSTAGAAATNDGGDGSDAAGEAADDPALPPAPDDAAARALLDVIGLFSTKKLLEWIELLSLMGLFNTVALPALRLTQRYLQSW